LLSYATVTEHTPQNHVRMFRFPVVLAQIGGSVFWLLVFRESGEPWTFYPFVSCYAANVAIIALVRHKFAVARVPWSRALAANVAKGMIVAVPAILLVDGLTIKAVRDGSACLLAVLAATALFYRLQPALATFPVDGPRWVRQALIVAATSPLALIPFLRATGS
jgi:phytol kinase